MPKIGSKSKKRPTAVGAYVFAGGFTLGLKRAGFDVTDHLEAGKFGVATAQLNFPSLRIHQTPESWPIKSIATMRPDLVFCNPPCSPWSTAGIVRGQTTEQQTDWKSHEHAKCVARCFSLLSSARPSVWCFESVRQVYSRAGDMLSEMASSAMAMGYSVSDVMVEGKNHGVPQHRKRYFMVCSRVEIDWMAPTIEKWPTVDESLSLASDEDDSVGTTPSSVESIMSVIGQGENARMAWDREVKAGRPVSGTRPAFIYDRMAPDRPSYTLLGSCNKIHPHEDRMLSVNETKVLCGFPPTFKLVGSTNDRYAQLGKGVCPPVAEWLGRQIRTALNRNKTVSSPIRTLHKIESTLRETDDAKNER